MVSIRVGDLATIIIKFRLSVPRNKKDLFLAHGHTSSTGCQDALLITLSQGPRLIKTPSQYISTIAETGKRKLKPESAMKLSSLDRSEKMVFLLTTHWPEHVMGVYPTTRRPGNSFFHMLTWKRK